MTQLEAQLLQDAAQERSRRAWGKNTRGEAPKRPTRFGCYGKHEASIPAPYKVMGEKA